jgi:hypothetical protein
MDPDVVLRTLLVPSIPLPPPQDMVDEKLHNLAEVAPQALAGALDSLDALEGRVARLVAESLDALGKRQAAIREREAVLVEKIKQERERTRKYYCEDVPKSLEERKRLLMEQLRLLNERYSAIAPPRPVEGGIPELKVSASTPTLVSAATPPVSTPPLSTPPTLVPAATPTLVPAATPMMVPATPPDAKVVWMPTLAELASERCAPTQPPTVQQPPAPVPVDAQTGKPAKARCVVSAATVEVPFHTIYAETADMRKNVVHLAATLARSKVEYCWIEVISADLAVVRLRNPAWAKMLVTHGKIDVSCGADLVVKVYSYGEDLPERRDQIEHF